MDATDGNISPEEMLEKIAELDYSQSQLRGLNAEMRQWLDLADDDMVVLRSENAGLRKQVKALERMLVHDVEQVEAEPCRSLSAADLDLNRCSERKLRDLEMETAMMKEQIKELTAKLKGLEKERSQDKRTLSKLRTALQTHKDGMEAVNLTLHQRDEVIHQKSLQLKYLEETVEECLDIIKDLRLTKQELLKQLDDRREEASLAVQTELMREKDGSLRTHLSIAEEIQLLGDSADVELSTTDFTELQHEESEEEELLEPHSLTADLKTKRFEGTLTTTIPRAGQLMLCIVSLSVLACVALGSCEIFYNMWWSRARLMLQPYFSVHYGTLPPI
ncbi:uncharacterized protein PAE49_014618 isoform 2-T4 [Odontesthes bonariensis]